MHASVLISSICILIALAEGAKYFNVRRKKDDAIRKPIFTTHGVKDYHLASDDGDVSLTTDATLGAPWEIQQPVTQHDGELRSEISKASSLAETHLVRHPGPPLQRYHPMHAFQRMLAGVELVICIVAFAQLALSVAQLALSVVLVKYGCKESLYTGYTAFMITVSGGVGWFVALIAWPLFATIIFVALFLVARHNTNTGRQCMPQLLIFFGCCWVCKTSPVSWCVEMCGMGNNMRDVQDRLLSEMWWNPWTYVSGWFFGWDHGCLIPQSTWNDAWFGAGRSDCTKEQAGPVGPVVGVASK
eukprot:TRINITY_DN10629_c0_g3_i1.p1 TRINITY_DN10629_c0_g3~~TRINITY_DN10629_c0_g3_i1.p1  ORF type:complete len:301 (-),score=11.68 TRINITY_DN10629_c0_g3_i1:23-925(-)